MAHITLDLKELILHVWGVKNQHDKGFQNFHLALIYYLIGFILCAFSIKFTKAIDQDYFDYYYGERARG